MEYTYEDVVNWFEGYFKAFNENAGPLETVPNMLKFFTSDLEFWPYIREAKERKPMSRDDLIMTMIHPGLHEELTPREYIVDLKWMAVVVQFQLQFSDEKSGTIWPAKQASAHYHLVPDNITGFKINKILYFIEVRDPEVTASMNEIWGRYKNQALTDLAISWIHAPHKTLDEINAGHQD